MVDIPSISAAIMGLRTAAEIARAMKSLHDLADVQSKVIDLQSAILDAQTSALAAQSDQFTMMQRLRELEEEVRQVRAWEETKQRYKLITPWPGCHVYALKAVHMNNDPPHWICPQCYEDGKKSLLLNSVSEFLDTISCPRCSFKNRRTGNAERKYV